MPAWRMRHLTWCRGPPPLTSCSPGMFDTQKLLSLNVLTTFIAAVLLRSGSSDEVALLIAEFGLLDGQLSSLVELVEEGHPALIPEEQLSRLATDVPDLRARLGIGYVFCYQHV